MTRQCLFLKGCFNRLIDGGDRGQRISLAFRLEELLLRRQEQEECYRKGASLLAEREAEVAALNDRTRWDQKMYRVHEGHLFSTFQCFRFIVPFQESIDVHHI